MEFALLLTKKGTEFEKKSKVKQRKNIFEPEQISRLFLIYSKMLLDLNFLTSGIGLDLLKDSGKYPCAVSRKCFGSNSIACFQSKLWVHKKCCGISMLWNTGSQPRKFRPRCTGLSRPIDVRPSNVIDVGGTTLNVEPTFCYMGDLCVWGL